MRILINQNSVLPVEDELWQTNPLKIFDIAYIGNNLLIEMSFPNWLNRYLLPTEADNFTDNELEDIIENTLNDTEMLRGCLLKLFPTQYEFSEQNWSYIETELKRMIRYKRVKEVQLHSYAQQEQLFTTHINSLMLL